MTSPLLERPGAVPAPGADAAVGWHYGDPLGEQRRLEAGVGVVDLSHHGVVRVTGPARLGWLNDLTSQELRFVAPGQSTQTLLLDPHGRIEHALHVVDDGTSTWLLAPSDGPAQAGGTAPAAALAAYLLRMRFWTEVEVEDVSAGWATLWTREPLGDDLLAWSPAPDYPLAGHEVLVPRDHLVERVAGRPLAGVWAREALRIAAGVARPGLDTDERTLPHELGWIGPAVALDKGCYRGQETVARVHNIGRPPRRLTILHLDGSASLPETGDPVGFEGREVGRVGSLAQHAELGPIALALVRRAVPEDATLVAGEAAAAQETPALLLTGPRGGAGRVAQQALRVAD